jgi:hypothetical protein
MGASRRTLTLPLPPPRSLTLQQLLSGAYVPNLRPNNVADLVPPP